MSSSASSIASSSTSYSPPRLSDHDLKAYEQYAYVYERLLDLYNNYFKYNPNYKPGNGEMAPVEVFYETIRKDLKNRGQSDDKIEKMFKNRDAGREISLIKYLRQFEEEDDPGHNWLTGVRNKLGGIILELENNIYKGEGKLSNWLSEYKGPLARKPYTSTSGNLYELHNEFSRSYLHKRIFNVLLGEIVEKVLDSLVGFWDVKYESVSSFDIDKAIRGYYKFTSDHNIYFMQALRKIQVDRIRTLGMASGRMKQAASPSIKGPTPADNHVVLRMIASFLTPNVGDDSSEKNTHLVPGTKEYDEYWQNEIARRHFKRNDPQAANHP